MHEPKEWAHVCATCPVYAHNPHVRVNSLFWNILWEYGWLKKLQVCSKMNQLYMYIHTSLFRSFSHVGCYRVSSRSSYAVGPCYLPTAYIVVYICQSQGANLSLLSTTFSLQLPQVQFQNLWVCFCFVNQFSCIISLDSTYKWDHRISVFICFTSVSVTKSRSISVAANGIISFFFMAEYYSIVYIPRLYSFLG